MINLILYNTLRNFRDNAKVIRVHLRLTKENGEIERRKISSKNVNICRMKQAGWTDGFRIAKIYNCATGAPTIIREASKLDCVYQGSFAVHTLISSTSTVAKE